MGEGGSPGEPDELCFGAEQRSYSGRADGLDSVAGADGGSDGAGGVDAGRWCGGEGSKAGDVAAWTDGERADEIDGAAAVSESGNGAAGGEGLFDSSERLRADC